MGSKTWRNTSSVLLQQISLTTFDTAVTGEKPRLRSRNKGPVPFVPPLIEKEISIVTDLKPSVPVRKTFDAAVTGEKPKLRSKKKGPPLIGEKSAIAADLEPSVPVRKWIPKPREETPAEKAEVEIEEFFMPVPLCCCNFALTITILFIFYFDNAEKSCYHADQAIRYN